MQKIKSYVRYLIDNGLLFEINRKVLNPLGLALAAEQNPDNAKWLNLHLYETMDDDGIVYDEESFEFNKSKYDEYLRREGQAKILLREKLLGFIEQTGDKKNG